MMPRGYKLSDPEDTLGYPIHFELMISVIINPLKSPKALLCVGPSTNIQVAAPDIEYKLE